MGKCRVPYFRTTRTASKFFTFVAWLRYVLVRLTLLTLSQTTTTALVTEIETET